MKVLINLLKFIMITILAICVIAIGIIKIISSTILDKNYVTQKIEETNFYEETYKLVKSNFENYIYQSGLDEKVLENICTEEKVKKDIDLIISNIYEGTNQKIDTTEIANNLNSNIDKLEIKNSRNEKPIQQFIQHICDEYTNTILHTNYEENINNIYEKIVQTLGKLNKIIIIILVIDVLLIIIINNKKISKNLQHLGIATLTASIFELIVCNVINSKINIQEIKAFNDAFSNTIIFIIQDILEKVAILGIISLIISLLLIITDAIIVTNQKD